MGNAKGGRLKTDNRRQITEDSFLTHQEKLMGEQIKSFKDLNVYKAAFELQQKIFEITKEFPK